MEFVKEIINLNNIYKLESNNNNFYMLWEMIYFHLVLEEIKQEKAELFFKRYLKEKM